MTTTYKIDDNGKLLMKTTTARKWVEADMGHVDALMNVLSNAYGRPHPNVAWFAKRKDMPQPDGKHVSILLPLGTMLFGSSLIAAAGAPLLATAVALASGLGCGWIQRNGRA